jgi:hypothetical protein
MTRRSILLRSWMLVLAMFSLTALMTSTVQAQDDCKCDYGTIYVSDAVTCKFEVCVKTASSFDCYWVGPGSVQQFKCDQVAAIFLKDCKGNLIQVTEKCVFCICVGDGCYVDACLGRDENGCLYIKVSPAKC